MRRLFLVVVIMSLLTACSSAPRPTQGAKRDSGELRPAGAGQISPAKPGPGPANLSSATPAPGKSTPTTAPQTSPTQANPTSPAPASPTPPVPTESGCTAPSAATLQAKGSLLKADDSTSFYTYPWGATCKDAKPVQSWIVNGSSVTAFPSQKQEIRDVRAVTLPINQRGYFMEGRAETPSATAYFLLVMKDGLPRLYHFDGGRYGGGTLYGGEAILSTGDPEIHGDQLWAMQIMGRTHVSRSYQLDPQNLTATLIKETES